MLDSEYCIILAYPHGASGKFLINCLCMNKEFCPQVPINTLLALHQENIQQEFILKKLQTFINENPNTFEWNDLSFGDSSFFNVDNFDTHLLDQRQEFLEYSLEGLKKSILGSSLK